MPIRFLLEYGSKHPKLALRSYKRHPPHLLTKESHTHHIHMLRVPLFCFGWCCLDVSSMSSLSELAATLRWHSSGFRTRCVVVPTLTPTLDARCLLPTLPPCFRLPRAVFPNFSGQNGRGQLLCGLSPCLRKVQKTFTCPWGPQALAAFLASRTLRKPAVLFQTFASPSWDSQAFAIIFSAGP